MAANTKSTKPAGQVKTVQKPQKPLSIIGLIMSLFKGLFKSLPKMWKSILLRSVISFLVVMAFNFYTIAVKNEGWGGAGFSIGSFWGDMSNLQGNQGAFSTICFVVTYVITMIISQISSKGFKMFFLDMADTVPWTINCFHESGKKVGPIILITIGGMMVIGILTKNEMLYITLMLTFFFELASKDKGLVSQLSLACWNDFHRVKNRKKPLPELKPYYVGLVGFSLFAASIILFIIPIPQKTLYSSVLLVLFVGLGVLLALGKIGGKAAANIIALVLINLVVLRITGRVYADDGGWQEGGGTVGDYMKSSGSREVIKSGAKPGMMAVAGGLLSSAVSSLGSAVKWTWGFTKAVGEDVIYVGKETVIGVKDLVVDAVTGGEIIKGTIKGSVEEVGQLIDSTVEIGKKGCEWVKENVTVENIKKVGEGALEMAENGVEAIKQEAEDFYNDPEGYVEQKIENGIEMIEEGGTLAGELSIKAEKLLDDMLEAGKDPRKVYETIKKILPTDNIKNMIDPKSPLGMRLLATGFFVLDAGQLIATGGLGNIVTEAGEQGVKTVVKEGLEAGVKTTVREGIEEGIEQGVKTTIREGIEAGTKEGIEQGAKTTIREGIEAGTKEGIEQGAKTTIREGAEAGTRETIEAGAREGIETGTKEAVETGARETAEAGTKEAVETGARETAEAGTKEAVETGAKETAEAGTKEAVETGARETAEAGTKEAVETGAKETAEAGTKEAVETGAKETAEAGTKEAVETGAKETAETGTKEAVETGARETAEAGTKEAVETGAKETAETGTKEAVETGAKETAETGAKETAEAGAKETAETGAKEGTEAGAREGAETGGKKGVNDGEQPEFGAGENYNQHGAGDSTWMTENSQKAVQQVADDMGVQIHVRPGNKYSKEWLDAGDAIPKPELIKNKTINDLDVYLGAPADKKGLVGHFKPIEPSPDDVPKDLYDKVMERFTKRSKEFDNYSEAIDAMKADGVLKVSDDGIISLAVKDPETGQTVFKQVAGDVDLFDVTNFDGSPLPQNVKDMAVKKLQSIKTSNVEHRDLLSWDTIENYKQTYGNKWDSIKDEFSDTFNAGAKNGMIDDAAGKEGLLTFNPTESTPTHNTFNK